jgi:hypothetical protein
MLHYVSSELIKSIHWGMKNMALKSFFFKALCSNLWASAAFSANAEIFQRVFHLHTLIFGQESTES